DLSLQQQPLLAGTAREKLDGEAATRMLLLVEPDLSEASLTELAHGIAARNARRLGVQGPTVLGKVGTGAVTLPRLAAGDLDSRVGPTSFCPESGGAGLFRRFVWVGSGRTSLQRRWWAFSPVGRPGAGPLVHWLRVVLGRHRAPPKAEREDTIQSTRAG